MRARYRSTCKFGCDPRRRSPPTSGDTDIHALAPRKYTSHAARIHSTRDCSDTEMRQYRAYQASPPGLSLSLSTHRVITHIHTPKNTPYHVTTKCITFTGLSVRSIQSLSLSLFPPLPFVQPYTISPLLPGEDPPLAGFMLLSVILRLSCITF